MSDLGDLPQEFDLCIGNEQPRRCRVAWRRLNVIGVEFTRADPDAADGRERRAAPRRRTLKGGTIVFNGGHSTIACRIVNLSDGGARLRSVSPHACPTDFDLVISGDSRRGCVVVRRDSEDLGVRFLN